MYGTIKTSRCCLNRKNPVNTGLRRGTIFLQITHPQDFNKLIAELSVKDQFCCIIIPICVKVNKVVF